MLSDQWLYTPEIAAELRVSEQTVRKWIRTGLLPGQKFGRPKNSISLRGPRPWRVLRRDLERFIRGEIEPATEIPLDEITRLWNDA